MGPQRTKNIRYEIAQVHDLPAMIWTHARVESKPGKPSQNVIRRTRRICSEGSVPGRQRSKSARTRIRLLYPEFWVLHPCASYPVLPTPVRIAFCGVAAGHDFFFPASA